MKKNKLLLVLSLVGCITLGGINYSSKIFTNSNLSTSLITKKLGTLNKEHKNESLNAVGEIALETLDKYVDVNNYYISRIIEIQDFNNNPYVLVEFNPIGYLIYNVSNGDVVECGPTSKSPYLNTKVSELYYLPMVGFFSKTSNKYINLMEHREVSEEEVKAYKVETSRYHESALKTLNSKNIEKAYQGSKLEYARSRKRSNVNNYIPSTMIYADHEVPHSWYFKRNVVHFANAGDESCGYIAVGMLLSYFEICITSGYFSPIQQIRYITPYNGTEIGVFPPSVDNDFLYELSDNLGPANTAQLLTCIDNFLEDKTINYTLEHTVGLFTDYISPIEEDGVPTIYCGNMPDFEGGTGNHAIIAYGTYDSGNILCHYGWGGYSQVIMSNIGILERVSSISIINHSNHSHNRYYILNDVPHCSCGMEINC